jgi:2-methylcitrate dehydratase PrpD
MSVARELADFLSGISAPDLPPQTLDHAAMLVASTLASAAMGSGLASSAIIRSLNRERGGAPEASCWFDRGAKLPAADAAQINAVMSDAAASDDSDLRNVVHAGTTTVATALAVAERIGAGGADVLTAIVLGYEAAGRMGEAITPGFRERGFHGCLVAIFGAAVAAGRLLRLDAARLAQAIALSATSIGGLMAAANTALHASIMPGSRQHSAFRRRSRQSAATGPRRASSKPAKAFLKCMEVPKAPPPARARAPGSATPGISSPTWRSS